MSAEKKSPARGGAISTQIFFSLKLASDFFRIKLIAFAVNRLFFARISWWALCNCPGVQPEPGHARCHGLSFKNSDKKTAAQAATFPLSVQFNREMQ
jgi:hypothetical protein